MQRSGGFPDGTAVRAIFASLVVHSAVVGACWLLQARGAGRLEEAAGPVTVQLILEPNAEEAAALNTVHSGVGTQAQAAAPRAAPQRPAFEPAAGAASSSVADEAGDAGVEAPAPSAAAVAAGDDYRRRLLEHIQAYRRPVAGADRDAAALVMVTFEINRGGDVLSVQVASSSGAPGFDAEAVATVWRAGHMPAIPAQMPATLSVTLPIRFGAASLRKAG
jgi:TonB family protein